MTNLLWFFALILIAGGNGFGGLFGGNRPIGPQPASIEDVNTAINNQTIQNQLSALGVETANNNYETARLIQQQTSYMMQQNNTNLINAIQGFNNIALQMQNQTSQLSSVQNLISLAIRWRIVAAQLRLRIFSIGTMKRELRMLSLLTNLTMLTRLRPFLVTLEGLFLGLVQDRLRPL